MKSFLYGPGTRVRVRRGRFPLDPSLVGRSGLVVQLDDYRQQRYAVVLDGASELLDFAEEELLPLPPREIPVERSGSGEPEIGIRPAPSGGSAGKS